MRGLTVTAVFAAFFTFSYMVFAAGNWRLNPRIIVQLGMGDPNVRRV